MMQVRYGEMWICVREGEDVCMWFAAKWIFAGTMVAFNPGQSLRPIQTQHHTKFGPIRARLELPAVASICDAAVPAIWRRPFSVFTLGCTERGTWVKRLLR
jgi:hypothetical protein